MNAYRIFTALLLASVLAAPGFAAGPAAAEAAPAVATPEPIESQLRARDLLLGMARFLAAQEAFSVDLVGGYDVVQADGQKIEFVESRSIGLARPDHLRIVEEIGATRGQSILFDGTRMTIWDEATGVFAQADQPQTVDDGILYFIRDLQMRLPLAPLFTTWFPTELEARLRSADYVEETGVFDQPAHHVAARTAAVDVQVWIAAGEQPVPLRIVLTYPEAGQPQYWAQFSGWNFAPQFVADTFVLNLPEGLQQVAFAVQVPPLEQTASPAGTAPEEEQP